MSGLDSLGTHELVGFDYMSLLKGAAGMLSGGMPGGGDKDKAAAEKQRLEEERARAEKAAARMKTILIAVASLAGVGIVAAALLGRKRA